MERQEELEFVWDSTVLSCPSHSIFNIKWQNKVAKSMKLEPVQSTSIKAMHFVTLLQAVHVRRLDDNRILKKLLFSEPRGQPPAKLHQQSQEVLQGHMNVDRGSGVPSLIATIVMDKEY
jgi:hypothetical protein